MPSGQALNPSQAARALGGEEPAILRAWCSSSPKLAAVGPLLLQGLREHLLSAKPLPLPSPCPSISLPEMVRELSALRKAVLAQLRHEGALNEQAREEIQSYFEEIYARAAEQAQASEKSFGSDLRSSHQRFVKVAQATGLGIWYCDLPFSELKWNAEVKRHFFLPPDARVTIENFYERMHPEDRDLTRRAIDESIRTGERYDIEYRTTNPANPEDYRWIRAVGWTAYNEAGAPISFDGFTLDITDTKRVEAALAASQASRLENEQLLKTVTDRLPSFVAYVDQHMRYRFLNESYRRAFGPKARPGASLEEVVSGDALERALPFARKALAGEATRYENTIFSLDGKYTLLEVEYLPDFHPRTGEVRGYVVLGHDITEQRRVQEDLAASARRFQSLTETIPQIVWATTPQGEVTWFSKQWYNYTGMPEDADWKTYMHPDDIGMVWETFKECLASGREYETEHRVRGRDGQYRWFLGRALPVRDPSGEITFWLGTNTDINDRMETSRVLKERSELFRLITDTIPQGVWRTNPDGSADYFSQRFADLVGYPVEKMLGWGWAEIIHPEDQPRVLKAWQEGRDAAAPVAAEFRVRSPEGRYRWFISLGNPFFDASGNLIKYYGTWTEIDEQKTHAEQLQTLAETSLLLNSGRSLAEKLNVLTEQSRQILGAHQAALRLEPVEINELAINNCSLSEKYAHTSGNLLDPAETGLYDLLRRLNHPVRCSRAEIEQTPGYRQALGSHPAPRHGFLAAPLVNAKGEAVGVLQVSDKYEGEFTDADQSIFAQLAQIASAAIENAQLLERERAAVVARDEFLSIASHELKTPLTSIKLQSQIFQRMVEKKDSRAYQPERLKAVMEQTSRQVNRLTRLVDDMLDISRIRTGKLSLQLEPLALGDLVRESVLRMEPHFKKEGLEAPALELMANPIVSADAVRLEQVINNLLTNALRYGEKRPVLVILEERGAVVRLTVRDQGMGVEAANLEKIFDRFERAVSANEVSGLGLGLFISRQITTAHGGRIWAESAPGRGSSFIVELPKLLSNHS